MTTWRELPTFQGIDLEDSWIRGWHYDRENQRLVFDVELSLWPGHPAYEAPRPKEWTCYKHGQVVFSEVDSLEGLADQESILPTIDSDGTADFDSFDGLQMIDGVYEVAGAFGKVRLTANMVTVELGPEPPVA